MTPEEKKQKNRERCAAYAAAHREEARARASAWYCANKEKARVNMATWRKANPEKDRTTKAAWKKANIEKVLADDIAWHKANPERVRVAKAAYRARISGAEGSHTGEEIKELLSRQKCRCVVCRKSIESGYHEDHIIPLSRGGSNYIRNIQLLCPKCNMKKSAKHPIQFMREQGFLL